LKVEDADIANWKMQACESKIGDRKSAMKTAEGRSEKTENCQLKTASGNCGSVMGITRKRVSRHGGLACPWA